MARLPYKSTEAINDMNTRQLRQYISDKATEAQARLDTVKIERTSKAFKEALQDIQGRGGKIKRSTSNMSKAEMLEYANALREFNALDVAKENQQLKELLKEAKDIIEWYKADSGYKDTPTEAVLTKIDNAIGEKK